MPAFVLYRSPRIVGAFVEFRWVLNNAANVHNTNNAPIDSGKEELVKYSLMFLIAPNVLEINASQ